MSEKKFTVLCVLPNASKQISGISFEQTVDGMIARDVPEEIALKMGSIEGYEIKEAAGDKSSPPATDNAKGAESKTTKAK